MILVLADYEMRVVEIVNKGTERISLCFSVSSVVKIKV